MPEKSLPPIGVVHVVENGIRTWHPSFNGLQVAHVAGGSVVLTYYESNGGKPVLFEMTPAQRDQFINLLLGAAQQQPAGQEA